MKRRISRTKIGGFPPSSSPAQTYVMAWAGRGGWPSNGSSCPRSGTHLAALPALRCCFFSTAIRDSMTKADWKRRISVGLTAQEKYSRIERTRTGLSADWMSQKVLPHPRGRMMSTHAAVSISYSRAVSSCNCDGVRSSSLFDNSTLGSGTLYHKSPCDGCESVLDLLGARAPVRPPCSRGSQ